MATGLANYLISVPAQEGSEFLTAHIPGELHTAITSSFTLHMVKDEVIAV